jgi:hypothetical protein
MSWVSTTAVLESQPSENAGIFHQKEAKFIVFAKKQLKSG